MNFMRTRYSKYSGEPSTLLVDGIRPTFYHRSEQFYDDDESSYHPLLDEFELCRIEINGLPYLSYDKGKFIFHQMTEISLTDMPVIHHGPDVINGHEDNILYIGVLTNRDNNRGLFKWFLDGKVIIEGPKLCFIKVTHPGKYHCLVMMEGAELVTKPVVVHKGEKAQT